MEVRNAIHPQDFENYTTDKIRKEFLVQNLFVPGELAQTYSYYDRMIVGGACPNEPLSLAAGKEIGSDYFLARREMGIINVGPAGAVTVDGQQFDLDTRDGLYIGMGANEVVFSSNDNDNPAHFYTLSGPAHRSYPTRTIEIGQTERVDLGTPAESNVRTLHKYIHPDGIKSCQLSMGMTNLEQNSVWNSMPCHTHPRRMEIYFYFNLPEDAVLFHLMGQPDETRHIVVRNEEAVISPNWSIHAGAATSNYSFIWGMIGENQMFTDMDAVAMADLK